MKNILLAVVLTGASTLMASCSQPALSGPPELKLGRHECAACGMLINEDRCSAAAIVTSNGAEDYAMFDDIGCLLDYEFDKRASVSFRERFVHDHSSRGWCSTPQATFLFSDPDRLPTPMGSGIIALSTKEAAVAAKERFGGEIMSYEQLVPARRKWMEARYGKPDK